MIDKSVTIVVTYSDEYDPEFQIDRLTEQLTPLLKDGTITDFQITTPTRRLP